MRAFDVTCPICGHKNESRYLEETEGWMECDACGNLTQIMDRRMPVKSIRIPVLSMEQFSAMMKNEKAVLSIT